MDDNDELYSCPPGRDERWRELASTKYRDTSRWRDNGNIRDDVVVF